MSGTVTYRGKPVEAATIALHNKTAGIGATAVVQAGTFRIDEPIPVGTYQVGLTAIEPDPEPGVTRKAATLPLPKKFQSTDGSGVQIEVVAGQSDYPIELKD